MTRIALLALLSILFASKFRSSSSTLVQVEPNFCPIENLVGVRCETNRAGLLEPSPTTIASTLAFLRCNSGCVNHPALNISKEMVDFSQPWPYLDPDLLPQAQMDLVIGCRIRCPLLILTPLPKFVCTVNCPIITEGPDACKIGCDIGEAIRNQNNNPNLTDSLPILPLGTPSIYFEYPGSNPWEFSLNLSSVIPDNFSVPVNTTRSVAGFALEILIEENGANRSYHYPMFHPSKPGTILFSSFQAFYGCSVMYYSVSMVDEFGFTPLTPHVRSCIPGTYSLAIEPGQDWAPRDFIVEGSNPNPDLGQIFFNWGPPPRDNIFYVSQFEVRGRYKENANEDLNRLCLGNITGQPSNITINLVNITEKFTIMSGSHGLIKLISVDTFCTYLIDVTTVWHTDQITFPFLRDFRHTVKFTVEVIYNPSVIPSLQLGRELAPMSDGTYKLVDLYGCLSPQENAYFEAFNSASWNIFKLVRNSTSAPGANSVARTLVEVHKAVVTRAVDRPDNPCISSSSITALLPPPEVLNSGIFEQLDRNRDPDSLFQIEVTPIRSAEFSPANRRYLDLPSFAFSKINPDDLEPVPPHPVPMLRIDNCVVMDAVNMSLTVSWQPPTFIFGQLDSCTVTSLGQMVAVGPTQTTVNVSLSTTVMQQEDNITISMDCTNSFGLRGQSKTAEFDINLCQFLEVSIDSSSVMPSSSPGAVSPSPTTATATSSSTVPTVTSPPPTTPVTTTAPQVENFYIAIGAGGGLIVALILLFAVIMCFFCCRRKKLAVKSEFWELRRTRSILRRTAGLPTTGDDWEVDPNHLFMNEKLGEGNFGEVYKATLAPDLTAPRARKYADTVNFLSKAPTPCFVAVKVLKTNAPSDMKQSFLNEIRMMKTVASGLNMHVVKMVGCVSVQEPLALVLEFVPYGNLLDYLRTNRKLAQKKRQLKKNQRPKLSENGRYVAGVLTPIEEASLHSMDSESYLSQAPHDAPHLSVSPPRDSKNGSEGSGDLLIRASPYMEPVEFFPSGKATGHDRPASYIHPLASPNLDLSRSDQLHLQNSIDEQTMSIDSNNSSTRTTPTTETTTTTAVTLADTISYSGSRKSSGSSANNPLYDEPEVKNPYPALGELEAFNLIMFAYQIASGMEYLASLGIVHRDLACRNVLVDRDKILKISDFGLSRETDMYVSSTQGKLPLRWMSPEAILDRVFTEKSDIWAYGITIWEICTLGGYPYATIPNKAVLQSLLSGYRLEKPHNVSEEIQKMMNGCWDLDPESRPNFQQLRQHLDVLMENHQAEKYIRFSDIDDDKLPYYRAGAFSGSGSGSGDDNPFEIGNGTLPPQQQVTLEPANPYHKIPYQHNLSPNLPSNGNGNGNSSKPIPISPQSSAGTIKDELLLGDEKSKNHDLSGESSQVSLSAHESACTIKDEEDSSEESKL